METEQDAHMMIGFEIVFPALIRYAEKLELDIPYGSPVIQTICAGRQKKLDKYVPENTYTPIRFLCGWIEFNN